MQCRQLVELQKDLKSSTEKMLSGSQQSVNPAAGKNDAAAKGQGKSGKAVRLVSRTDSFSLYC